MTTCSSDENLFGPAFRAARRAARMTQEELSQAAGVSRRTIIRWESGETSPWVPELESALDALRLTTGERARLVGLLGTHRGQVVYDSVRALRRMAMVRTARLRAELRTEEVAAQMERDPSTVARWESGRLFPDIEEFARLWAVLAVAPEETALLDVPPHAAREETLDDHLRRAVEPQDHLGLVLLDIRFLRLFEAAQHLPDLDRRRVWAARTKAAYAWNLAASARYDEAREYADEVVALYEGGAVPSSTSVLAATIVAARCRCRNGSDRAFRQGLRMLDALNRRPLDSELLACRLDAYAEAHMLRGAPQKALDRCDQAIRTAVRRSPKLVRLLRFNKARVLLQTGQAESALESLPAFSDLTPLNDAGEALVVAGLHAALGRPEAAEHWRSVAQGIAQTYGLERAIGRPLLEMWGVPPPFFGEM